MCFFAPGAPGGAKRGQTGDLPGGVRTFLDEVLARSPRGYRLYALRADPGFLEAAVPSDLEQRELPYAIAVIQVGVLGSVSAVGRGGLLFRRYGSPAISTNDRRPRCTSGPGKEAGQC